MWKQYNSTRLEGPIQLQSPLQSAHPALRPRKRAGWVARVTGHIRMLLLAFIEVLSID